MLAKAMIRTTQTSRQIISSQAQGPSRRGVALVCPYS